MTTRSLSRSALLVVLLHGATACSFGMKVAPSPVSPPDRPVDCNGSSTAPVLDTICAALMISATINVSKLERCRPNDPFQTDCVSSSERDNALLVTGSLAALCSVGAVVGWTRADACGKTKALNQRCIAGDDPACMRLDSSWTPPMRLPAAAPSAPPALPAPPAPQAPAAPDAQPAPTPPAPTPAAPAEAGCTKDVDCKGDRVCERGVCVAPRVSP